ncbi:peroxiredoxin family protein [Chitinophaga flava]|uniref:Thioredoxin domain-containing protein n=1 Tax=Chitinophaga flava TaxID=2259036 RepID=A0A365XPH3_9BACT|nr:hypothetical protein [Chitinophaga flava]RBL88253.1 hypothetical protein DF182_16780 [Chitinophaga flava]
MQHPLKLTLWFSIGFLMMVEAVTAQGYTVVSGRVKGHNGEQVSVSWWSEPGVSQAVTEEAPLQQDTFCFRLSADQVREGFVYVDAGSAGNFYGMLRAGDSVQLSFEEDTMVFTGRGALACRVQYLARHVQERIPVPVGEDAVSRAAWHREQLRVAERMLKVYRDSLPPAVYAVVRANVLGETAGKLVSCLWRIPQDSNATAQQATLYQQMIRPALPAIIPSDTTAVAVRYLNYLLQKAEADYFMQRHSQCTERDIYEWIKTHYTGVMRDKLLAHHLLQSLAAGGQPEELARCAEDYLTLVQHAACRQAIATKYDKLKKGLSKGAPAPPFTFPDSSGHNISLNYFTGKVVLLHFYDDSDQLLPSLAEINACFNKDDVVFVHICCNNGAPRKYPGVQLQAGGQTAGILEQYNISQYPGLIVIGRNGNIYATRPPDPTADHGAALADIIYAALLQ